MLKLGPSRRRATCWFSCWELWLLLHGDEEKRGLGWEEEKAPGTPMKKLWIQAHVQTQVQVLKCLLLQEQQRQDEDSGKVQRDRLAQLLTSKVHMVKLSVAQIKSWVALSSLVVVCPVSVTWTFMSIYIEGPPGTIVDQQGIHGAK